MNRNNYDYNYFSGTKFSALKSLVKIGHNLKAAEIAKEINRTCAQPLLRQFLLHSKRLYRTINTSFQTSELNAKLLKAFENNLDMYMLYAGGKNDGENGLTEEAKKHIINCAALYNSFCNN